MKNKIILGICAILAVIGLSQSIVITYSDEYTLIKQFKKVESVVSEPGLSFKTPFIQSTQKIPKKKMIYDIDPSDTTTKDKKIMSIDSFVIWSVEDPTKYLSTLNASEKKAKVRISNTVYNSMKTIISSMTQNEIIENRDGKLAKAITGNISNLDAYGIKIYAVETKKLDLADSNKESVYKRMISDRQNIAAQYTADGEYQSSLIKNETSSSPTVFPAHPSGTSTSKIALDASTSI